MDNNIKDVNSNVKYIAEPSIVELSDIAVVELNAMIDARIEQNRNKTLKTDFLFWFVIIGLVIAVSMMIYGIIYTSMRVKW